MGANQPDGFARLMELLPGPPAIGHIRTTNVWIVEWLPAQDLKTGKHLHDWIENRRPGWAAYSPCGSKAEVLAAIERATVRAERTNMIPVLHLEAHGDEHGLAGPNGEGGSEVLSWDELTTPLQRLNVATRCNLLVVNATCTGFAGIRAFYRGPRAPAVALVGPDATIPETKLLWGTKEFYRRYTDPSPNLTDIAASASREAGTVEFEPEPFAVLALEAMIQALICDVRPGEWAVKTRHIRERIPALQRVWNELFMIDLCPDNEQRFGVDMTALVEALSRTPEPIVLAAAGNA